MGTSVSAPSRLNRFWPEVLGVQEALERLGRVEPLEDAALLAPTATGGCGRPRRAPGSTPSGRAPGCACTRRRPCARTRRAARRGCRGAASTLRARRPAPRLPTGNSRSRSQIERSWCVMSSSGWVCGLAPAERVEVGDEVAAHAVHVDRACAPARPSRAAASGRRTRCGRRSSAPARTAPRGSRRRRRRSRRSPSSSSWMRRRNSPLSAPVMMRWS